MYTEASHAHGHLHKLTGSTDFAHLHIDIIDYIHFFCIYACLYDNPSIRLSYSIYSVTYYVSLEKLILS